jgi:ubiquinone/menaquinone biosynthesis C-methylase UbiE
VDHETIYARAAEGYDELVRAEDCDGQLIPALDAVCPLDGAAVLEVGAGTGRITRALAGRARRLVAIDRAAAMLAVARRHLPAAAWCRADARALPVAPGWADVAVAGWVFGHFRSWMADGWRHEVGRALDEMRRALRPGGALIIVETLGTGSAEPAPPTPGLAEYYAWLEETHGFARRAIRTDYRFRDVEEAARVCGFFFGAAFGERVRAEGWARVPEHTGVWSKVAPR